MLMFGSQSRWLCFVLGASLCVGLSGPAFAGGTVYSWEALEDPYNWYMTLGDQFLDLAPLDGVITDTHFAQRDRRGDELTPEQYFSIIESARDVGLQHVKFTGGEPFLNPDFLDMLEDALRRGFEVLVLTNAMQPMQREPSQVTMPCSSLRSAWKGQPSTQAGSTQCMQCRLTKEYPSTARSLTSAVPFRQTLMMFRVFPEVSTGVSQIGD